MKRLLWKEFRERWPWLSAWAAAVLVAALIGGAQDFAGDNDAILSPWLALPLLAALVVGTGAFTSEVTDNRATFTFSRPISWRSVLAAKLLLAAVVIFGVPLLAAVAFRFISPAQYHPFISDIAVVNGVWALAWKMGACYLFGMACSAVLPGLTGGFLTLVGACVVVIGTLVLSTMTSKEPIEQLVQNIAILSGAWIGALLGGLLLARFGLSVSVDERIKRFTLAFVPAVLAFWVASMLPLPWANWLLLRWTVVDMRVSPGGQYATSLYQRRVHLLGLTLPEDAYSLGGEKLEILRLADASIVNYHLPTEKSRNIRGSWHWEWLTGDTLCFSTWRNHDILMVMNARSGHSSTFDGQTTFQLGISPDGRFLPILQWFKKERPDRTRQLIEMMSFIDLHTNRIVKTIPIVINVLNNENIRHLQPFRPTHWQTDHEVGYLDERGNRHILSLEAE